jgi:hypothetical protein
MKLTTEAIVGAAITVIFGALSLGAIAREQDDRAITSHHDVYAATSDSSLHQITANRHGVLRSN